MKGKTRQSLHQILKISINGLMYMNLIITAIHYITNEMDVASLLMIFIEVKQTLPCGGQRTAGALRVEPL